MPNCRVLASLAALLVVLPTSAHAYCAMPNAFSIPPSSASAWAQYNNCVQQQRQVEIQRQQMELQRRQMEAQQLEMQRQTRIQQQQLELQRQQFEEQQRLQSRPPITEGRQSEPIFTSEKLSQYLTAMANSLNAQLPIKIDESTTLIRSEAGLSTFTYIYSLSFEVNDQAQINAIASAIGPKACRDITVAQNVNEHGVKYIYRYFTPSNRYFDIFLNPGTC